MIIWTNDELSKMGTADELEIAPRRCNGTLRNPVTIWVVHVDNDLYVRSYRGANGVWFRAAQVHHEGYIRAGGIGKDVTFVVENDPRINDQIDAAYRAKYRRYPQYMAAMVTAEAPVIPVMAAKKPPTSTVPMDNPPRIDPVQRWAAS